MGTRRRVRVGVAFALTVCLGLCALAAPSQSALRWRDIRGTNYLPTTGTSDNNIGMWLPWATAHGTFDAGLVDAELGEVARLGLNSIRVFGSFWAFVAAPAHYERDLTTLLQACRRHDLKLTFVVWDAFGRDGLIAAVEEAPEDPGPGILARVARTRKALHRQQPTMPATVGGFWFASPGRAYHAAHPAPGSWGEPLATLADRYLDLLGRLLGNAYADVFHAYDLYNEPENMWLVPGVTFRAVVQASADLCHHSLARLRRRHPTLAYTVGTAFINTCEEIDRELQRRGAAPMDYFSYHDYDHPSCCARRAAIARYHGLVAGRDVVCSEFHQAARQGGLWPLLGALQQMRVGGQIWGCLEDRVFVVEFPELQHLLGGREQCWFRESGLVRPLPDARRPGSCRFVEIDPIKCSALRAWAADQPLPPFVAPGVTLARTPTARYRLEVTGLADQFGWLLVAPAGAGRMRLPGLGVVLADPRTQVVPLGALTPTGRPGEGRWQHAASALGHAVVDLEVQALVGSDYDPRAWRHARVSAASRIVRVRL